MCRLRRLQITAVRLAIGRISLLEQGGILPLIQGKSSSYAGDSKASSGLAVPDKE